MENPTPNEGASIQDRIETFLAAEEPQSNAEEAQASDAQQAETEVDAEPPEGDEGEQTEQPSVALSDLAQYLGIDETLLDVDEDGKVVFKTKIDGQEGKTKLTDALTSYQLKGHLDNKTRAQAEAEKAWQAQVAQTQQALQQQYQYAEDLANAAQQELNRRFQSVDWQTLRVTDPAEYAALLQDFQAQQANIQNIAQTAQAQRNQYQAQQEQSRMAMLNDLRVRSEQVIAEAIPEWRNPETRQAELPELARTIRGEVERFFGPEADRIMAEIDSGYYGPLPIIWARKAALYDKMQSSKAAVENRVRQAPKLVKPGQTAPNGQDQQIRNLKANIKKTGGKQGSIAEYLLATGKV